LCSQRRCRQVTGRGSNRPGPRIQSMKYGRASRGRWTLFFEGGLVWSHGRGKWLPAFFGERDL